MPVAIVICTEIENHDIFRDILIEMFDSIRDPEAITSDNVVNNKQLAFSDLIAHIAYLKTIPCPTFNSRF